MKIQGIQGEFCEIPLAKLCVKYSRFGTNDNVEITVGILGNLRLADLLLGNNLFQANSKLRDPIEIVNFDVPPSPVMDKVTSSEPIGNQISVTYSEQNVEQVELATLGDQIVESVVTSSIQRLSCHLVIRLRLLQSLGHHLIINLRLMTEILILSHCQMRQTECSEAWI